jgi:putative NADPH-quinone reductase
VKPVINLFHPRFEDSVVGRAWAYAATFAGFEVRNLYALYPDFQIDVIKEQSVAELADVVVFQHPLHWYGAPPLMKKWVDDVLTYGWAYGGPNRLAGKSWMQAVSIGGAASEYTAEGSRCYSAETFLIPWSRVAAFCGMDWETPFIWHGPSGSESEACEAYVRRLNDLRSM